MIDYLSHFLNRPGVWHVAMQFLVAVGVSNVVVRLMIKINISDAPVARSVHHKTTPRAGGIGIIIGFLLPLALFHGGSIANNLPGWPIILSGILLIAVVKFFDDINDVSPGLRFIAQLACSAMMVYSGSVVMFEPGTWWAEQHLVALALSALCFLFAMNATNFADGLNGLLASSVLVAVLWTIADLLQHNVGSELAALNLSTLVIFAGAILGFFVMNFPKAKIFMGDVGSSFLGIVLGVLALLLQHTYRPGYVLPTVHDGPFTLLFPLSFLWFDVIFTILRRAILRRKLSQPHQDHMFHLLYRCGYSHTFITSLHIIFAFILGLANYFCHLTAVDDAYAAYLYYFMQALYLIWVFNMTKQRGVTV